MATLKLSAGKIARRIAEKGESGTVCGVFSQGIYCKIRNEILLFHDAKWGYVPFGVAVKNFPAFAEELSANTDDTVILTENTLTVGGKELGIELECEVPAPFTVREDASPARLAEIFEYVKQNGSQKGVLEYIMLNRIGCADAIKELANGNVEAAVKLIGLGRGLTPSGDDFLCGYFAVLNALGVPAVSLREKVFDNLNRTNLISGAYVSAVLGRRYFTIYDRVVRAIFSDGDWKSDVDFVLALGASSGTDTLIGALVAAKYRF